MFVTSPQACFQIKYKALLLVAAVVMAGAMVPPAAATPAQARLDLHSTPDGIATTPAPAAATMAALHSHDNHTVDCRVTCPTVMMFPHSAPLWTLNALYVALALLCVRVVFHDPHPRLSSFRAGVLWLLCFGSCFRVFTYTVKLRWTHFHLMLWMYAFPIFLQYLTFSLLTLFLIKCLMMMQNRAQSLRRVVYPAYVCLSLSIFGACVGFSWWSGEEHLEDHGVDYRISFFSTIVFTMLTLGFGIIGYKTHALLLRIIVSDHLRRKVVGISWLCVMYFGVNCFRMLYAILYMVKTNPIQNLANKLQKHKSPTAYYWLMLSFYLVVEILPGLVTVLKFWRWVPKTGSEAVGVNMGVGDRRSERRPLLGAA
eukprot:m.95744 g.95744  ORF g.95744 m.95744 type:complete len:369 (-) comp15162_c1_seq1:47-1153(-)